MRDDSGQRGRTARGERWARLRRSLWQPPRPHGEQPRERVVGPLELFYDLAVVVLVARGDRSQYRRTSGLFVIGTAACAVVAVACVGIGAARPAPLLLGLALVVLLSIPWGLAVARRLASPANTPAG